MNWTFPLSCYVIAAFGLAYIAGHALITRGLREWAYGFTVRRVTLLRWLVLLVECPACLGFWIGMLTGWWLWRELFAAVAVGCYTSGTNFLLGRATGLIAKPRSEE